MQQENCEMRDKLTLEKKIGNTTSGSELLDKIAHFKMLGYSDARLKVRPDGFYIISNTSLPSKEEMKNCFAELGFVEVSPGHWIIPEKEMGR